MKRYFLATAVALGASGLVTAQGVYQPPVPVQNQPIYPTPVSPLTPIPGQPVGPVPGQMTGLAPGQLLPPFPNQPPLVYPNGYFQQTAQAVNGHPGVPPYPGMAPVDPPAAKHGWHPLLRFKRHAAPAGGGCDTCGASAPAAAPAVETVHGGHETGFFKKTKYAGPPAPAEGGTLVFPHHQFVRSPRDWFQQD